ncbi:MAG: hypothetical protein PWP39_1615 [Pyrococcus sp.]|uniref:DUF2283 domain-containing protein n=1 Tax=Pyrococcus sp. TaxID=33866 RepID=UPI0025841E8F|nr:DUF2283 domain-containing protein [Pyrococcus sp.]MDK2870380.1 hypothetical protein [Pyrococcus sp.]
MKISYDPKSEGKIIDTIDYDENGEIVGIEIINVSMRLHGNPLQEIIIKIEDSVAL